MSSIIQLTVWDLFHRRYFWAPKDQVIHVTWSEDQLVDRYIIHVPIFFLTYSKIYFLWTYCHNILNKAFLHSDICLVLLMCPYHHSLSCSSLYLLAVTQLTFDCCLFPLTYVWVLQKHVKPSPEKCSNDLPRLIKKLRQVARSRTKMQL